MQKKILILIISIMFIMSFSSCGLSNNNNEESQSSGQYSDDVMDSGPVKGGTLNLFCTKPDYLNPILSNRATVQNILGMIFEGLVKLDGNQKPVPCLSDTWNVSPDGLIWTFHIRDNVYWQDKIPMTAEDVEFTIQTLMNASINSVYKSNIQNIATLAAIDRNTIRIFLKKPDAFTAELMTFPIIPKHYFLGEDMLKTPKNFQPVGTGPFKFENINASNMILSVNDGWWNANNEKTYGKKIPYLSEINIKILDTAAGAVSSLQTGDVDMTPIPTGDSSKYSGRSDLIIKRYPSRDFDFIAFNMTKTALKDKIVRQAISYAIDRNTLIGTYLSGDATVSDLPVVPGTWLNDNSTNSYDFDILKARDILANDGWKTGSNGMLYKITGGIKVQLALNILVNESNTIRNGIASKIAEQLSLIGIKLNITKVTASAEINLLKTKKFDMAFLGVRTSNIPDLSFMYSTDEISTGRNIAGYSNPLVDGYLQQMMTANDDNSKKNVFTSIKNILEDEVPYIGLYFYDDAVIYKKNIRGELNPCSWDIYNDVTRWYISKTNN